MMQDQKDKGKKRRRNQVFDQTFLTSRAGALSLTNRIPFPLKLFQMLEDVELCGNASIVSWSEDGKSFRVHKTDKFVDQVMPHYFRQTRYKSFQRQLHLYGFTRIVDGKDKGSYHHDKFIKADRDLCQEMEPLKRKMPPEAQNEKFAADSKEGETPESEEKMEALHQDVTSATISRQQQGMRSSFVAMDRNIFPPEHMLSSPGSIVQSGDPTGQNPRDLLEDPSNPTGMTLHDPLRNYASGLPTGQIERAISSSTTSLRHPQPSPTFVQQETNLQAGHLVANQVLWMNMLRASAMNETALAPTFSVPGPMRYLQQQHQGAQSSSVLSQPNIATTMMMQQMHGAGLHLGRQQGPFHAACTNSTISQVVATGATHQTPFFPQSTSPLHTAGPTATFSSSQNAGILNPQQDNLIGPSEQQRRPEGEGGADEKSPESISQNFDGESPPPGFDFDYSDLEPRPI